MEGIDKPAMQSKKFVAMLLGCLVMAAVGVFGLKVGADSASLLIILSQLLALVGGYIGGVSWQEKAVRLAAVTKHDSKRSDSPVVGSDR